MDKKLKVLLLGSGGREHAFAWKMAKSPLLESLFIAPGNAGTSEHGTNVNLNPNDFDSIGKFCQEKKINLLVVGPEEPLVNGIHDYFLASPWLSFIPVIGPSKAGATLEGSKAFSKEFMKKYGIPTAAYGTFHASTLDKGIEFLNGLKPPYVLKADGLAAGKGVLILNDKETACRELEIMLSGKAFGAAGTTVVIEEFLDGVELSVFVLTDGKSYKLLPEAKDYKRIGEGDTGLNTGGMGAVSPVPFATGEFMKKVEDRIIIPTMEGLKSDGIDYRGFIFFGLINVKGQPMVIEYNCRMGDPETEAVIPRIKSDLLELFVEAGNQNLYRAGFETDVRPAATIVLVSGGYPGKYEKGILVDMPENVQESLVFHAGTKLENGQITTSGGRVFAVTSLGENASQALMKSYNTAEKIIYAGKYFRKDIGKDLQLIT